MVSHPILLIFSGIQEVRNNQADQVLKIGLSGDADNSVRFREPMPPSSPQGFLKDSLPGKG